MRNCASLLRLSVCAVALCNLLSGCGAPAPIRTESPSSTTAVAPSPAVPYTTEDAIALFDASNQTNGIEGRTATACVLAEDNPDGMNAVLLYTDDKQNNSCQLGFVFEDTHYFSVGITANEQDQIRDFEPEPDTLTYVGNSTVTVILQALNTGIRYRYTVTCERSDTDASFTVSSDVLSE